MADREEELVAAEAHVELVGPDLGEPRIEVDVDATGDSQKRRLRRERPAEVEQEVHAIHQLV